MTATLAIGCSTFWEGVRENERQYAATHARTLVANGSCEEALRSLERSQAAAELGSYAAESTILKSRCLSHLGREEEALAHLRLLRDHYPESTRDSGETLEIPPASLDRLRGRPLSTQGLLQIPEARYSPSAERSDLEGSVVVEYMVGRSGQTRRLRVVNPSHPLLASWALEAIAAANVPEADQESVMSPIHGATRFEFRGRWPEVYDLPPGEEAAPGDTADREDDWDVEWFPRAQ